MSRSDLHIRITAAKDRALGRIHVTATTLDSGLRCTVEGWRVYDWGARNGSYHKSKKSEEDAAHIGSQISSVQVVDDGLAGQSCTCTQVYNVDRN
jgi:hypothetical protein